MKQTAVEWLETQIVKFHNWKLNPIYDENCFDEIELDKSIKQAKEMEKIKDVKYNEMLEMLMDVKSQLKGNGFPRLTTKVEQLIKEATEI